MEDSVDRIPMDYLSFSSSAQNIAISKEDESAYERFCELRVSRRTVAIVSGIFFVSSTYVCSMSLLHAKSWIFLGAVFLFGCVIRNPILLFMVYYKNRNAADVPLFIQAVRPHFPMIMNIMSVLTSLTVGLFLIARVLNGKCQSLDQVHMWSCNSEYDSHALPQETLISLMLLPLVFSIAFKNIRSQFIAASWVVVVLCVVISIIIANAFQSIPILLVYSPLSVVFLHEIHRQNVILFLLVKKQQTLLHDNKKLSEESQNELRFMIANMAHDLKTPLSAFMNGVESLSSIITDIHQGDKIHSINRELHVSAKDNIKNLFTVNNFMTMTVNRCIDYMKASKGIKLEPRLETINLQEVLSMPLNCMRDLQSRIAIIQNTIPANVCSHIITDLQWFQENLFCLISNAVKYSSHGHISVSVTVTTASHPRIFSAKLKKQRTKKVSLISEPSSSMKAEPYVFLDRLAGTSSTKTGEDGHFIDLEMGSTSLHTWSVSRGNSNKSPSNFNLHRKAMEASLNILKKSPMQKPRNKVFVDEPPEASSPAPAPVSSQNLFVAQTPSSSEEMLLIEVEDTGIGLSDEAKETLFTPFKQAQRRAGGTGLGLYSLAKRVDALGGYYGVRNRSDGEQGSIFWFAIPYRPDTSPLNRCTPSTISRKSLQGSSAVPHARSGSSRGLVGAILGAIASPAASSSNLLSQRSANSDETKSKPNSLRQAVPQPVMAPPIVPLSTLSSQMEDRAKAQVPPGKLRILLVDDSLTILKMTSNLLKRHGHVVDQEENGADALNALEVSQKEGYHYDVMLIDLNMPVMDGLEATKRLRELERARCRASGSPVFERHQNVFAFSANSDSATMQEAMEAGADDFITKPFSIQTFNDKIDKLMNR